MRTDAQRASKYGLSVYNLVEFNVQCIDSIWLLVGIVYLYALTLPLLYLNAPKA